MGFFLGSLSLSTWNLALICIIVYLAISSILYAVTFYLKRKRRLAKQKEDDIEQSNENSFLASIKSTRSSSLSTKTAKSEMARTQRDEKSTRDNSSSKSNGLLQVRRQHLSARFSDGKTPLLPDNVLPKVKMSKAHYFEEWKDDITQELTKSIREREHSPPLDTAAGPSSKSIASTDDSESTDTQTASETSYSEGSDVEKSSSAVPSSEGKDNDEETSTNEEKTSTNGEETSKEEETSTNEDETSKEGETSNEESSTKREEESDESSSIGEK